MMRTWGLAAGITLLLGAILMAEPPRKKDVVEPPKPEKPKIEPPKPEKPKVEPPKPAPMPPKPKVDPPKPVPAPEKPKVEPPKVAKPMVAKSPFTTTESSLEKLGETKKTMDKKKPEISKPKVKKQPGPGSYIHAVTIPLKKNAPSDTAGKIVEACREFRAIPSVRSLKVGRPAEKHSPEFVHKDYSVALVISVDNHEGLLAYLNHKIHKEFLANYGRYIDLDNVRVIDFEDE